MKSSSLVSPSTPTSSSSSPQPAKTTTATTFVSAWNQQLISEIETVDDNSNSNSNSNNNNNSNSNINGAVSIMSSFYFGSSSPRASSSSTNTKTNNKTDDTGKTKISVSIIGDAFVDLFCYLNDGSSSENGGGGSLPQLGADVRVNQPVKPVAGGSGINTATHLASLVQDFPFSIKNKNINNDDINGSGNGDGDASTGENENEQQVEEEDIIDDDEQMDVTVQTVVNENDDYGRLLLDHAKQNNFEIINCRRKEATTTTTSSTPQDVSANNNEEEKEQQQITKDTTPSTGHCIVLVTQNERSFITHLGIMKSFQPSHTILHELVHCRSANPTFTNHHHHVHIAGYYNVPKFHSKNALKKRIKLIREKRRTKSHGQSVYTTTISLTPQYDATEKWETTELFNLLPLVDFLILNLIEACHISKVKLPKENEEYGGSALDRSVMFLQLADFFDEQSPQTYVVVTLGKLGAVLLYGGEIVHTHHSPAKYDTPVDATGAGDAFVSGFLYGTMNWRRERQHNQVYEIGSVLEEAGGWNEAIEVGMKWGCVAGTACVMKAGASVPSSKDELLALLHPPVASEDEDGNENGLVTAESGEIGYEDEEESELDSDYVPDENESSSYYSSSYADGDYFESFSEEGDNEDNKDEKRWL